MKLTLVCEDGLEGEEMHLSTGFFESWNTIREPFKIGALHLAFFGNICQILPHRFLIHFKNKSHSPYLQINHFPYISYACN